MADAAGVLDPRRPGHGHAVAGAAEVRGHLLGPLIRRVPGPGPAHRVVRVGLVGAPDVVELHVLFDRRVDAIRNGELVVQAVQRAFGARAVVAADVDDQRIVELAGVLDRLDHAADLVVGIGEIRRIDIGLADVELLRLGRERVPLRQVLRPGRELGVLRDHAELLLVGEDRLTQLVPAVVEQMHVADLVDPLLRRVVRRSACRRARSRS